MTNLGSSSFKIQEKEELVNQIKNLGKGQ